MAADPKIELKRSLEYLESISKGDGESLKNDTYKSFSGLCYLALEAKKAKFKPGWVSEINDSNLNSIFHEKESSLIEKVFLELLEPIFYEEDKKHVGGGISKEGVIDKLERLTSLVNKDDISVDKTYSKAINFLKGLNEQSHTLSREIGPFKYIYDSNINISIQSKRVNILISAFIEAIRLLFSLGQMSNEVIQKAVSIVMVFIDLIKGEWKHGIINFAEYYNEYPMLVDVIGKIYLNIFNMVVPNVQDQLIFDIDRSRKSKFIGGFLWIFNTLAPMPIRAMVKNQLALIKDRFIEDKPEDLNNISDIFIISFDDIKNLLSISQQQTVLCSNEFQEIIKPIVAIVPVRFFLELLNIPTDAETVGTECDKSVALKNLTRRKGGARNNTTRRNNTKPIMGRYATMERIILETADV